MFFVDKEPDGAEIKLLDDMNLTVSQIFDARVGKDFPTWPDGVIPFEFSDAINNKLDDKERNIVMRVVDRFNKDLKGCLIIR